jgi:hypothetical protein
LDLLVVHKCNVNSADRASDAAAPDFAVDSSALQLHLLLTSEMAWENALVSETVFDDYDNNIRA